MERRDGGTILLLAALAVTGPAGAMGGAANPDQPVASDQAGAGPTALAEGLTGLVRDAAGRPVAGAWIRVESLDPSPPPAPDIAILSNAEGQFEWPLRPGRYRVTAMLDGRELATATVTVPAGATVSITLDAGS